MFLSLIARLATGRLVFVLNFEFTNSKLNAWLRYVQVSLSIASPKFLPKHALYPPENGNQALGLLLFPSGFRLIGFELSNLSGMNS